MHPHMSSSSSKPAAPPPIIPELQLESTLDIPPDPGNISQSPNANSNVSSNTNNNNINASPTPRLAQNVYPLVAPMRIICSFISQVSFFLAYVSYKRTQHYKAHVASGGPHHEVIIFVGAIIVNIFLILLMFFGFFSEAYVRYLHNYLLKSVGELMVMFFTSLLMLGMHQEGISEIAALVTCAFVTIYALCIFILLRPGHHYSLLDASVTLTLHLGLMGMYSLPAVFFVLVTLIIKNYLWSRIDHAQAPSNLESHRLVRFASDQVDNLSAV